jgi:hypothetical protein
MIYGVYLIDGDSGILLLERFFHQLDKKKMPEVKVITNFFSELNTIIDDIQLAMVKGRDLSNMNRIISSENSTIILHYYSAGRILICSISDPDDENAEIIEVMKRVGLRFWNRFHGEIEAFRLGGEKPVCKGFDYELDILFFGGKIAYHLPQLIISPVALDRVRKVAGIDDLEYKVALLCNGKNSEHKIIKDLNLSQFQMRKIMQKLLKNDIIELV